MSKTVLLITDKDLDSENLTGIELRFLQMKSYFEFLNIKVSIWQPRKSPSFLTKLADKFIIGRDLLDEVRKADFVYSSLTSSRNSMIYRLIKMGLETPLILDVFTPLLLEKKTLSGDFMNKLAVVKEEISAAQHFICATPKQKIYNIKLIKSVAHKNSDNIAKKISIVPYFPPDVTSAHQKKDYLLSKKTTKIFWIGAFYPWFDERKLQELIKKINSPKVQFVILGGKNPKTHAYDKKFSEFYDWAKRENKTNQSIVFIDWLPYQEFQQLLRQADLAILFVKKTPEDKIAIRSRLISALMAGVPVLTNGEDELTRIATRFKLCWKIKRATDIKLNELSNIITQSKKTNSWKMIKTEIQRWKADDELVRLVK